MKPPKFHVGQAVTPIGNDVDDNTFCGTSFRPKMGAIYTVNWVGQIRKDRVYWSIGCEEWPQDIVFEENGFAPVELLSNDALAELLSETLELVTA